ncbi:unnamed protein product, partial [Polarella glacialis]
GLAGSDGYSGYSDHVSPQSCPRCSCRSSSDGSRFAHAPQTLADAALLALGPQPRAEEVHKALEPMAELWRGSPRLVTKLLSNLAKERLPAVAIHVLGFMQARRVEANAFHYGAAMSACDKGKQWQLALSLLLSMTGSGLAPDLVTYNSAISALSLIKHNSDNNTVRKGGQWCTALALLADMTEARLYLDQVSYNTAITACSKQGEWQLALDLFRKMSEMGVEPDHISYNAAITACSNGDQWHLSMQLFGSMAEVR